MESSRSRRHPLHLSHEPSGTLCTNGQRDGLGEAPRLHTGMDQNRCGWPVHIPYVQTGSVLRWYRARTHPCRREGTGYQRILHRRFHIRRRFAADEVETRPSVRTRRPGDSTTARRERNTHDPTRHHSGSEHSGLSLRDRIRRHRSSVKRFRVPPSAVHRNVVDPRAVL